MDDILTFEEIKNNAEIRAYLKYMERYEKIKKEGSENCDERHANQAAGIAESVLKSLGYGKREQELSKIAAYIHDIGNIISRTGHDQSSAIMFLNIIEGDRYNEDIFAIANAVGCHEDKTTKPASAIAAALVIGDKTDVSHERIGIEDVYDIEKHFLVVNACEDVTVDVNKEKMSIELKIKIDTSICSVMNYFETFMSRINYCRRASKVLKCDFELYINNDKFL